MAIADGIVKKTLIVPFINAGTDELPKYIRIKKSTTFPLSFSPEVQTFDYISDETPTEELKSYKVALSQELTMYKGEPDFELIFDHVFNLKVGNDAKRKFILAFMMEEGTSTTEMPAGTIYKAWEVEATIKVNTLDSVAQTISFDLALNDPTKGAISVTDSEGELTPTFTEGTWDGAQFTPKAGK